MMETPLQKYPVAIIGQAAIFARAASLKEYWTNILNKVDSISEVPDSRWDVNDYYDPDPSAEDKTYCRRGGFIPDINFDPLEFGLPPNLLEVTDSSQLLGLVVARDAMENAGYGMDRDFDRSRTGVVLGVAGGQKLISDLTSRLQYPIWRRVLESSGISGQDAEIIIDKIKLAYAPWNENSFPGLLGNVIAGRIANRLDLGGMNSVVDAACASSLAAVKTAVSELVEGRADLMITGGVDADNSPFTFLCFSKTPAFSPSGEIRPFDQESDGMLIGEGLGMVVLKRLEDAERDQDHIYAVIRGIGSSSDGKYKSIYAPRPSGQSLAVQRAYDEAGFPPQSVGLIEAHGTGTKAGDPAEMDGLKGVFGTPNGRAQTIAIGSVKSQIGHTKAAAGAAGLIKTALALDHKILPPTINVNNPSPALGLEDSHFYVNSETRPWFRDPEGTPRRAAVSAFGFGGTNFHLVMEEYNGQNQPFQRVQDTDQTILLSAPGPVELKSKLDTALAELGGEEPDRAFQRLVRETRTPPPDQVRIGFAAGGAAEAGDQILAALKTLQRDPDASSWEHPRGISYRDKARGEDHKVVALFPGQGSQYLNMVQELVISHPDLRQAFENMDELFFEEGKPALSQVVFPRPVFSQEEIREQSRALRETDYAQAAIGMVSFGLFRLLARAGFSPDFTAGHSFGELSALWAGGVLRDDAFMRLVKARGSAMKPPDREGFDAGSMAAVQAPLEEVELLIPDLDGVEIANQNSPTQVVLAGPSAALDQAESVLSGKGYKVTRLPVSAAFHTPLVKHASEPFAAAVAREDFQSSRIPVYSNTTGTPYPSDSKAARTVLGGHILHPVIFKTQIENLYQAGGRIFVEIGPRGILGNLVKEILADRDHVMISINPSRDKSSERQLRSAVAGLMVQGINLESLDAARPQAVQEILTA